MPFSLKTLINTLELITETTGPRAGLQWVVFSYYSKICSCLSFIGFKRKTTESEEPLDAGTESTFGLLFRLVVLSFSVGGLESCSAGKCFSQERTNGQPTLLSSGSAVGLG